MVRECVVPFCDSKEVRKPFTTGKENENVHRNIITFHEIPRNLETRNIWLKNIARGDPLHPLRPWTPTDDRSKVCSRHFQSEDFRTDTKRRILLPSAIPTIFPDFPLYMKKSATPARKPPSMREYAPKRQKLNGGSVNTDTDVTDYESVVIQDLGPKSAEKSTQARVVMKDAETSTKVIRSPQERLWISRCRRYKQQVLRLQKHVVQLKSKIKKERAPTASDRKCADKIKTIINDSDAGFVKAQMLMEQIEAYGENYHRWSESVIRRCIKWRAKSAKSYEMARKSKFFTLPSYSTLQRYLGPSTLNEGVTPLIKKRLSEELSRFNAEETFCTLMFDEMSVKEQLKYVRNVDKTIGRASVYSSSLKQTPVANRMLCFVITGLSTKYRIPVAYYLTKQMEAVQLHQLLLDIITEVESIGFRIIRLVCDCLSVNVKAYGLISDGNLQHQIEHPADSSRILFLSFDPCHIMKNIRNQFVDEKRCWPQISSQPLKQLYQKQRNSTIKPVRFLNKKTLYPSNFEKMNVGRAVRLFSPEVIASLKLLLNPSQPNKQQLVSTIEFMELVRKWFDIHNVSNRSQYIRQRNSNKEHFWNQDDERLSWLKNDFLPYLKKWRETVHQNANKLKGAAKRKFIQHKFLTEETYAAIVLTTNSTCDCIKYLLESGFHFVLTRRFNSDPIELLFSSIRQSTGSCDATTGLGALYSLEKALKIGLLCPSTSSNVEVSQGVRNDFEISKQTPIQLKIGEETRLQANLIHVKRAKAMGSVTLDTAGISMIAGFCIKLVKDKAICDLGVKNLADSTKIFNSFILAQDRGGLQYPTPNFCGFVKAVFECMESLGSDIHFQKNIVKFWLDRLTPNIPDFIVCGCNNSFHTGQIRRFIVIQLVKIYVVNLTSVINDSGVNEIRLRSRPITKKVKKL